MNTEDSECNHTLTIQNISRHVQTEVHAALLDILQGVTRSNTAAQHQADTALEPVSDHHHDDG